MEKVFANGIRAFEKRQGAPDFVVGSIVITPKDLFEWVKANPEYLSDYKGSAQLKLDLLTGKTGLNLQVNTYKPTGEAVEKSDNLPF